MFQSVIFTEAKKYLKFCFLHLYILTFIFFSFFSVMSIVKSSKNRDQFLLDGYRYRRTNESQVIWHYCKNNCACRVRFDETEYVKVTDHVHAPNPEEIISMGLKSIINTGATTSHNPSRRIIHEALLCINKNICTLNG